MSGAPNTAIGWDELKINQFNELSISANAFYL